MLTPRGNVHHSKLPRLGAIVTVRIYKLLPGSRYERWIVESYPLTDAADPRYSRGIHTVTLRHLGDQRQRVRVAGHWCHEES